MAKKKKKDNIDLEEERYGLFMSENSYELDVMYGREYLKNDAPFFIKYYKVNAIKSKVHNLYGEAKPTDKKFFAPVKLNVMLDIEDGDDKYMSEGGIIRSDTGNLIFGIFNAELAEHNVEITIGDYVSYNMSGQKERFYEIATADYVSDSSSKTRGGYRSDYWKRIVAVPVKEDIVPEIMD